MSATLGLLARAFLRFGAVTATIAGLAVGTAAAGETVIGVAVASKGPKAALSRVILVAVKAHVGATAPSRPEHVEDDGCTSAGGAEAARRLVAKGVGIVFGHPCANAAIAAAKVYASAGVAFVAIGPRVAELTDKRAGPLVFRLAGRDDRQAAATIDALVESVRGRRLLVIHDRTRYQRRLAENVVKGLEGIAQSVQTLPIVAGEKGYDALVTALKVRPPDVIYLALFPAEARLIATSLSRVGIRRPIVLAEAAVNSETQFYELPSDAQLTWIRPTELNPETIAEEIGKIMTNFNGIGAASPEELGQRLGATRSGDLDIPSHRALKR